MSNETFEMPNHYFKCQNKWRYLEIINEYYEMSNQNLKQIEAYQVSLWRWTKEDGW